MQIAAFKAAIPNSGTPALRIFLTATNTAVMAWPASLTNVILEQTFVLGLTPWVKVTNAVHLIGDDSEVVVLPLATKQFFRLTVPN